MSNRKSMHGTSKAAGCSHARLGSFCKMFDATSWGADCKINAANAEKIAAELGGAGGMMHDADGSSCDSGLPAGYTFFAQFVDHDITLDVESALHGGEHSEEEIGRLPNLRSASLDLDSLYGFGPEASPHLYDPEEDGRLLTGSSVNGIDNPDDVPRNTEGRALIGDPRNDENLFVSQMQLLWIRFHNKRLSAVSKKPGQNLFEAVQEDVRFHYQYIVLYDFLKRICDETVFDAAVKRMKKAVGKSANKPFSPFNIIDYCGRICMPVEFSAAAYRFGHTLVRSSYPANDNYPFVELFDERFATLGFSQVPKKLVVDWRYLLDVQDRHPMVNSKSLDHLLADELIRLPDPVVGRNTPTNDRSLAFRNLLRGYALGLPSGQKVAALLKSAGYTITPLKPADFSSIPGWDALPKSLQKLEKHTPLFLYVLREAGLIGKGQRLGPVGSAILLEVFGTMLTHCDSSFLKHDWQPDGCVAGGAGLTLSDIVRYV